MHETGVQDSTQPDAARHARDSHGFAAAETVREKGSGDPRWFAVTGEKPATHARTETEPPELSPPSSGSCADTGTNIGADPDLVRLALHKILSSPEFSSAEQLRAFLRYVVEATAQLQPVVLKGYTIATEALGRGPDFNPTTDPIVRVEAARLRKRLQEYYAGTGRDDPIRIDIPKGSYAPSFHLRTGVSPTAPLLPCPAAGAPLTTSLTDTDLGSTLTDQEAVALAPPVSGFAPTPAAALAPLAFTTSVARNSVSGLLARRPELVGVIALAAFVAGLMIGAT